MKENCQCIVLCKKLPILSFAGYFIQESTRYISLVMASVVDDLQSRSAYSATEGRAIKGHTKSGLGNEIGQDNVVANQINS